MAAAGQPSGLALTVPVDILVIERWPPVPVVDFLGRRRVVRRIGVTVDDEAAFQRLLTNRSGA